MGYQNTIAVFVIISILKTFATPWQQRSHNTAPWDCGRISFIQKGHNTHIYKDEEVSKKCYYLPSAYQTTLLVNSNCAYKVETFSKNHCDDDSDKTEHLMNPATRVLHLNKLPICSFYIKSLPRDGKYLAIEFKKASSTKTNYVYRRDCYNICNGPTNFDYPDTVKLYLANGNIARGYSVQLYSTPGCDFEDKITNEIHERVMEENGAMDLITITQQAKVLSYAFKHASL